jgi:hypothetical protein
VLFRSSATDPIWGFVTYSMDKSGVTGTDWVNIASTKCEMYMEAGEEIPAGHAVAYNNDLTTVRVVKWVTGLTLIGYAMDQATNAYDLIRVQIETPIVSETVSS